MSRSTFTLISDAGVFVVGVPIHGRAPVHDRGITVSAGGRHSFLISDADIVVGIFVVAVPVHGVIIVSTGGGIIVSAGGWWTTQLAGVSGFIEY
jgi:hypothetical protein